MADLEADLRYRRRRSFILAVGLFVLIVVLTGVETYIQGRPISSPLLVDFLIFLLGNLNYLLMMVLIIMVFRYVVKLAQERRRKVLGSRFQTKLVVAFVAMSIIPATILYFTASRFIIRSIDLLFSPEMVTMIEDTEGVAQVFYRNARENALFFSQRLADQITKQRFLNQYNLNRLRREVSKIQEESNLGLVQVFSATGEELVRAVNPIIPRELVVGPTSGVIQKALAGEASTVIDEVGEGEFVRGVVPIRSTFKSEEVVGAAVVNTFVPHSLRKRLSALAISSRKYHQLKARRGPLTASYINLLLMITLLVIFSAIWLGIYLARGITIPIQKLAEATNALAEGDWDFKVNVQANDEVGLLIDSFNRMTDDLKAHKVELEEANLTLQRAIQELDQKGRYLGTLLESINTGVISTDPDGLITTYNQAASRILNLPADKVIGQPFAQALKASPYQEMVGLLNRAMNDTEKIEKQIRLPLPSGALSLLTHLTPLFDDHGSRVGVVAVFDDLTALVAAQKMAAWKEVAQRIAHEIKNPLTPVQLSAQRLIRKFSPNDPTSSEVFKECVDTIIKQVETIKELIDSFSRFARMPEAHPVQADLNDLVREVVAIYRTPPPGITITTKLASRLPRLFLDREQVKRVIVNLLENAVESMPQGGTIKMSTRYNRGDGLVRFEIQDQGSGINAQDRDRIFLPYFSTKPSGTGLGLAIVQQIVMEHRGLIQVRDNNPRGTVFSIIFPIVVLEKEVRGVQEEGLS